jgi:hypothetical protein
MLSDAAAELRRSDRRGNGPLAETGEKGPRLHGETAKNLELRVRVGFVEGPVVPATFLRRYTKVLTQPLRAPDEGAHQRGAFGRMGLKQEMRAVEDVRLHARERLHPGEGLLEVEEDIVPPP